MSVPPDLPETERDDAPLEASLARGLNREPLDAAALARIRAATQAEFESCHVQRRRRATTARLAALAAAVLLAVFIVAFALRTETPGVIVGSIAHDAPLRVGATFAASGATLIRLNRGGTVRVAPGTRIEATGPDELLLHAGRMYFDFPLGVHAFVVRSAMGTVEHLGTQFEVALVADGMRVRVREGAVRVHGASGTELADAGTEILVRQAPAGIVRQSVPTYGPDWAWVESVVSDFDIEDRPLADFLTWVGRETGRRIDFGDDRARAVALRTRLHGSIDGLEPLAALDRVLSTTSLRFEVHEDAIRVSSR